MIVFIAGEGPWLVHDSFAEELNERGARLVAAVELEDEIGFRPALADLSARVRSIGIGMAVAPDEVRAFDLMVPPEGATIEEARRLLLADQAVPSYRNDSGPDLVVRTRRSDYQLHAGTTYRIGRDPESDIAMTDSRVSWRHAVLRVDGGRWVLEDTGSTNGTFLGQTRVDRVEIVADCLVRLANPDDGPILRCMPPPPAAAAAGQVGLARGYLPDTTRSGPPAPAPYPQSPPYGSPSAAPSPEAGQRQEPGWQAYPAGAPGSSEVQSREPVTGAHLLRPDAAAPAGAESAAYDNLVRRAFADLVRPGRLLFNPPDRMRLGQTERVEVRLTRTLTLDAELLEHLRGRGEPQLEEIPTAPLMAVTLKGDGFGITAFSDEEQIVTQDGITTWEFDIRALKRGQQRLVICVSLRIPVAGQPLEYKSIPVREATIDVQVGAPALVGHFVVGNWQWFIGTAIAIAAVLVAVLH